MRAFLISLTAHLSLLLFLISRFEEPIVKVKESFLPVNLVSIAEDSSTSDSNEELSSEKKEPPPIKQERELKKETPIKKVSQKKILAPVEKSNTSEPVLSDNNNSSDLDKDSDSKNFISDNSGNRVAVNQNISGLSYKILSAPQPNYPPQARKVRINEDVIIRTKFLVGLDGKVEDIEILEGTEKFGFRNEIVRALKQWHFSPIEYNGERVKIYFYKDFIFNIK